MPRWNVNVIVIVVVVVEDVGGGEEEVSTSTVLYCMLVRHVHLYACILITTTNMCM